MDPPEEVTLLLVAHCALRDNNIKQRRETGRGWNCWIDRRTTRLAGTKLTQPPRGCQCVGQGGQDLSSTYLQDQLRSWDQGQGSRGQTQQLAISFVFPIARAHSYNQGNQVVTPYSTLLGSTGRLPLQIHDGTGKDGRDRYTMSAGDPQKRSSEVTNTTTRGNWPWYRLYRWSGIAPRIPRVPQVACRGRVSYGR